MRRLFECGLAVLFAITATAQVQAGMITDTLAFYLYEDGSDVRFDMLGSVDLTDLATQADSSLATGTLKSYIFPSAGNFSSGDNALGPRYTFNGLNFPSFGSANFQNFATTFDSGPGFELRNSGSDFQVLFVNSFPNDVSVSQSNLFSGATLASLGVVAGQYSLEIGVNRFELNVGSAPPTTAIPEPSAGMITVLAMGLLGLLALRNRGWTLRKERRVVAVDC